jgi:hypothetical protein
MLQHYVQAKIPARPYKYRRLAAYSKNKGPVIPNTPLFAACGYGARFPEAIYTRGCHWIPCMFA